MPTRVTTVEDSTPFIAQPSSLLFDMGRGIDWDNTGSATTLPAGTIMCIIAASGKMCPRLTRPAAETAYGVLLASADEDDDSGYAGKGLIIGGILFENMTPDFADASWATMKTELAAAGNTFQWLTYGDDRLV